jgi:hypothetical protein
MDAAHSKARPSKDVKSRGREDQATSILRADREGAPARRRSFSALTNNCSRDLARLRGVGDLTERHRHLGNEC